MLQLFICGPTTGKSTLARNNPHFTDCNELLEKRWDEPFHARDRVTGLNSWPRQRAWLEAYILQQYTDSAVDADDPDHTVHHTILLTSVMTPALAILASGIIWRAPTSVARFSALRSDNPLITADVAARWLSQDRATLGMVKPINGVYHDSQTAISMIEDEENLSQPNVFHDAAFLSWPTLATPRSKAVHAAFALSPHTRDALKRFGRYS